MTEPPSRIIVKARPALNHGSAEERRDAMQTISDLASQGQAACDTLQTDLMPLLVRYLEDEDDAAVVASTLLTIERMAAHLARKSPS